MNFRARHRTCESTKFRLINWQTRLASLPNVVIFCSIYFRNSFCIYLCIIISTVFQMNTFIFLIKHRTLSRDGIISLSSGRPSLSLIHLACLASSTRASDTLCIPNPPNFALGLTLSLRPSLSQFIIFFHVKFDNLSYFNLNKSCLGQHLTQRQAKSDTLIDLLSELR